MFEVAWIDPAGPAAKSGLVVGDVVTSVDGIDITGANAGLAFTLFRVPVGARVSLGLARGAPGFGSRYFLLFFHLERRRASSAQRSWRSGRLGSTARQRRPGC